MTRTQLLSLVCVIAFAFAPSGCVPIPSDIAERQRQVQESQAKPQSVVPKRNKPRHPGEMQVEFQTGHSIGIEYVAISSNGRYIASAGEDGVKIWDIQSGQTLYVFPDIKIAEDADIVFTPDNSQVLLSGGRERARAIDLVSGKVSLSFVHRVDGFFSIEIAAIGPIGSERTQTKITDLRSRKEVWTFQDKGGLPALSRDGKTLLLLKQYIDVPSRFSSRSSISQRFECEIWDVPSKSLRRTYPAPPAAGLVLSPDGRYAISHNTKDVSVFDAETGQLVHTFTMGNSSSTLYGPSGLRFSSDGKRIAFASRAGIAKVLEFPSGREIKTLRGSAINFSADGQSLVVGSSKGGAPFLYDLASGQETALPSGSTVTALGMSPDGKFVAAGMEGGSTKLWNLMTGTLVHSFDCPDREPVTSVAVSSASPIIATGCRNGSAWLWDITTGRQLHNLLPSLPPDPTFSGMLSPPTSISISRDGQSMVTGVGAQLVLWDLMSGKQLRQIPIVEPPAKSSSRSSELEVRLAEVEKSIQMIAFHPQGHMTVVLQNHGITSWDMTTGKLLVQYTDDPEGVDMLAITPDGNKLIGMGAQFAIVWEVVSRKRVQKIESGVVKASSGSKGGAVSTDGRFGARNQGQNIEVWDLTSGMEKFELSGHEPSTKAMVFTPSGRTLVTGGADGAVRLWDLQNGKEVAALISLGGQDFVTVTPDHYYRASQNPVKGVSFQVGDKLLPLEQFAEKLNKPDIVQQRLAEAFAHHGGESLPSLVGSP